MKNLKILISFPVFSIALAFAAIQPTQETKVYICVSGTSYAYHNKYCQGLKKCTHKLDTVTIKEAAKSGHKTACGYCYR